MQQVVAAHRSRMVRIGTAGWVISRQSAESAAGEGSHLERYARVLGAWSPERASQEAGRGR